MKFNFFYPIAGLSTAAAVFTLSPQFPLTEKQAFQKPANYYSKLKKLSSAHHQAEDIKRAEAAVQRFMTVNAIPGLSIGVTVDQKAVWQKGFGLADVETGAPCDGHTVMRIASISKAITSAIAGQLIESGQLDLDKSIYDYLPDYPRKKVDNEAVNITPRQLLSHMSGVRHYSKQSKPDPTTPTKDNVTSLMSQQLDSHHQEFYSNTAYKSVEEALEIFKYDDLLSKPGAKFNYTTHGFTLLSAVLQKCANKKFELLLMELFHELSMRSTSMDTKKNIVGNRAKYYLRNKKHQLENVPEVDISNKWAGGGIISNVEDLLTFANAMLYSYQSTPSSHPQAFLHKETMEKLWRSETKMSNTNPAVLDIFYYGLGWVKMEEVKPVGGVSPSKTGGYWFHTGAAVGASSVLLIKPTSKTTTNGFPKGVCVAILVNLQDGGSGIANLALNIAEMFENTEQM